MTSHPSLHGHERKIVTLVVATPLVFAFGHLFPFVIPKAVLFRSVVGLAAAGVTLEWALGRRPLSLNRLALRKDPLFWAFVVLVAAFGLAAALGRSPARSFVGTPERSWGVLTSLHLLLFYSLLRLLMDADGWRRLLTVVVVVGSLVALMALAEGRGALGWLGWISGSPGWSRISGTTGSPGFLAATLIIGAGVAGWVAAHTRSRNGRWLLLGGAALQLSVCFLTATRSILLGLIVGVAVALVATFLFASPRIVRHLAAGALGFLVLGGLGLWLLPERAGYVDWSDRLLALSLEQSSVRVRVLAWAAALEGIAAAPLFGVGPENFHLVWSEHFSPLIYNFSSNAMDWDRAHNVFLGMGAEAGLVGLTAYVAFWLAAGWTLWRAWSRRGLDGAGALIFLVVLITYLTHLLLWFEDWNSTPWFIAILAFLAHRADGAGDEGGGIPESVAPGCEAAGEKVVPRVRPSPRPALRWTVASLVVIVAAVSLRHDARALLTARQAWQGEFSMDAWEGTAPFIAALDRGLPGPGPLLRTYLRRLAFLSRNGVPGPEHPRHADWTEAVVAADRALATWREQEPSNPEVAVLRARLCMLRARPEAGGDRGGEVAGSSAASGTAPGGSVAGRSAAGTSAASGSGAEGPGRAEEPGRAERPGASSAACAASSLREAIALSPRRLRYRHRLAATLAGAGDPEGALEALDDALEVYDSFGETHYHRARVLWGTDRREEALLNVRVAQDLGYRDQPELFLLAVTDWLEGEGRIGAAAELLTHQLELRYGELRHPERPGPPGRGLRPWDRPLTSRAPLLHLRAGDPEEALRLASFLEYRLPRTEDFRDERRRVRRFLEDVRAGRTDRWLEADGILEGDPKTGAGLDGESGRSGEDSGVGSGGK